MKRFLWIIAAAMMGLSAMAQDKMVFVIEGSETVYNQIRVVNETTDPTFNCRVVVLDENDNIRSVYGEYSLNGCGDSDSNTSRIPRGTRIGIQMPSGYDKELSFIIDYIDAPLFDIVVVKLRDKSSSQYDDTF